MWPFLYQIPHAKHGQLIPTMAHSHYEYSQPESMFPAADSGYQFSGSMPKNELHDYHTAEDTPFQVNYKPYNERQTYPAQNIANTDEGDLGTRSRLTQEQLATLEAEFAERYKPNTEYKKSLAEKMGVEFQKVNVSDLPAYLIFHIDPGRRIGFRIAELKQNIRIHKSGDTMFHRSRRPIKVQQPPTPQRRAKECVNLISQKISLPQNRAQSCQQILLPPLTSPTWRRCLDSTTLTWAAFPTSTTILLCSTILPTLEEAILCGRPSSLIS